MHITITLFRKQQEKIYFLKYLHWFNLGTHFPKLDHKLPKLDQDEKTVENKNNLYEINCNHHIHNFLDVPTSYFIH